MALDTYSEQHRHECEVRFVCSQPFQFRREFLQQVEKRRGVVAADRLRDDVAAVWEQRKQRRAA